MPKKNDRDLERKIMNAYWKSLLNQLITFLPVFVSLGLLIVSAALWKGPVPHVLITSSIFIAGFAEVIIIIKREIPLIYYSITGVQAVGEGIIFTLICWVAALYLQIHGW